MVHVFLTYLEQTLVQRYLNFFLIYNYIGIFRDLHPPYLLSWIINCLENNSSETVTNLIEKITYNYEDFIAHITIKDPDMAHNSGPAHITIIDPDMAHNSGPFNPGKKIDSKP